MQIQQPDFMYFVSNVNAIEVTQIKDGIVLCKLSPQIEISHDYKKKNLVKIKFTEFNEEFVIPDRKCLEDLSTLHLEGESSTTIHEWCKEHIENTGA